MSIVADMRSELSDSGFQRSAFGNIEQCGDHFAGGAFDDVGEGGGVERWFRADIDGAGIMLAGPVDEVRGGIDGAGGADDEHDGYAIDLALNAVHFEGNLAEEDDVRAEARTALAARDFVEGAIDGVVGDGRAAALRFAAGLCEFAMHVDEARRAGALVEVVDVLRAEEEAVAEVGFELSEGVMRGIRHGGLSRGASGGVELPDKRGIAVKRFGSADVFDAVAGPESVGGTEGGQTALRADAGAREDEDAIGRGDGDRGHHYAVY